MTDTAVLQSASQLWSAYDWSLRGQEQEAALQLTKQSREASLQARKHLAETTKQFKRAVKATEQAATALSVTNTPDTAASTVGQVESLAKQCRVTIKSYQEEIDNLTRRCKSSETNYTNQCLSFGDLTDPAVLLQAALEQIAAQQSQMQNVEHAQQQQAAAQEQAIGQLQQELKQAKKTSADSSSNSNRSNSMCKQEREELVQLRTEVAEYEVEFRSLKNQDITIRKLEARIDELQTVGEEKLQQELYKAKEELQETEGRRAAEALEREAAMERQVQTLELQLKAERAGREATQDHLLEADEGESQREAAWEAQRRILVDDSERVRESLQAAVRERDELRLNVAAVQGGTSGNYNTDLTPPPSGGISMVDLVLERKAYEAEVAELSETAAILRDELRLQEEATVDEKRTFQVKIDALERVKSSLKSNLASLESQVASAPSHASVESMKRELRILKRLEYNADDVDADRDPEIAGGGDEEKDLETVLVGKLRRAESELVTERNSKIELIKQVDSLKRSADDAEQLKEEAEKLVSSLERDLNRAIATPSTPYSVARKSQDAALVEENPAMLQNILDPDAPPPTTNPSPLMAASASEKADDNHSVATIVMAQRDRLRARCEALEAERDSFKKELQGQVQASESLKADNTKLYEKVRYLQNYSKAPSSRGGAYSRHGSGGGDRDLDLEALEQRYEASVDPFRQFSKTERQRKLNEMSPMERTVFVVAKTVLCT
jgi:homeobox protein cut-like